MILARPCRGSPSGSSNCRRMPATRAAADIEEMRAMLGDVLRFAHDGAAGRVSRIDLGSVLDSLADDLSVAGTPVELAPGPRVLVSGDASALRRLFANLIENAVRYGDRARIGWERRAQASWSMSRTMVRASTRHSATACSNPSYAATRPATGLPAARDWDWPLSVRSPNRTVAPSRCCERPPAAGGSR